MKQPLPVCLCSSTDIITLECVWIKNVKFKKDLHLKCIVQVQCPRHIKPVYMIDNRVVFSFAQLNIDLRTKCYANIFFLFIRIIEIRKAKYLQYKNMLFQLSVIPSNNLCMIACYNLFSYMIFVSSQKQIQIRDENTYVLIAALLKCS